MTSASGSAWPAVAPPDTNSLVNIPRRHNACAAAQNSSTPTTGDYGGE
jgi:hypothetical protein